jgi:2-oxoglutarate dehydrogenase E2 component (dihydrolipoamide succinyltransferase)
MGIYKLKLPKMGESVAEATLTNWLKEVGDSIDIDDSVLEIATDKVDSDIPSEVKGILIEKKFKENDIIQVGQVIALIEAENYEDHDEKFIASEGDSIEVEVSNNSDIIEKEIEEIIENKTYQEIAIQSNEIQNNDENKFYSPLVKNIAKEEGISFEELSLISGTGSSNRVTKTDILNYISKNKDFKTDNKTPVSEQNNDQIIEL